MDKTDAQARTAALAKLTKAQIMIKAGRRELTIAAEKIDLAQQMIDESTIVLRNTGPARKATKDRP